MKLESYGVLISLRPINERDVVAHVFSRDCGVVAGVMRGALVAKKNKPLVGQLGSMAWNARLDSQLGTFHWEVDKNMAANLMNIELNRDVKKRGMAAFFSHLMTKK